MKIPSTPSELWDAQTALIVESLGLSLTSIAAAWLAISSTGLSELARPRSRILLAISTASLLGALLKSLWDETVRDWLRKKF
jgi:hypothetical protein